MTWICEKSFSLCIMFVSIYIFSLSDLEITELCIMEFEFHNLLSFFYVFFSTLSIFVTSSVGSVMSNHYYFILAI